MLPSLKIDILGGKETGYFNHVSMAKEKLLVSGSMHVFLVGFVTIHK